MTDKIKVLIEEVKFHGDATLDRLEIRFLDMVSKITEEGDRLLFREKANFLKFYEATKKVFVWVNIGYFDWLFVEKT